MELLVSLPRLHPSKLEGELDYCYTNLHVIPEVFKVHTHIHTNKVPINYWPKKVTYAMYDLFLLFFLVLLYVFSGKYDNAIFGFKFTRQLLSHFAI
jgi:hypothetical protein